MGIRVALSHQSRYRYDRPVKLGPQVIRLRPASHCPTPISQYSLRVTPSPQFLNWQQDLHSNHLARIVLGQETSQLAIDVNLIVEMVAFNPFESADACTTHGCAGGILASHDGQLAAMAASVETCPPSMAMIAAANALRLAAEEKNVPAPGPSQNCAEVASGGSAW